MKRTPLKKRSKDPAKVLKYLCDALLQQVNKKLHKHCEACGGENQVGHHWIEKSRSNFLRYRLENIVPLCNSCHVKIHNKFGNNVVGALKVAEIIIKKRGMEWKEEMERLQPTYVKTDVSFYLNSQEHLETILNS